MASDPDYLYALKLQEQLDQEENFNALQSPQVNRKRKHIEVEDEDYDDDLNATQNIVHPEWENIDPTPDVFTMFGAFDIKFFQGALTCVTLEWSKRMYSCAGICYSRRNRLGMQITIRLSEPLLKLRARKDLVETLLHEMIHAYLFVKNIREGNGGHGPNFKKIMTNINTVAGTNITVYHNFHDEVRLYKNHVWRCNGLCQQRSPFFGFVRRTCNRAPGPNDQWWNRHEQTCGGYFKKVSEPTKKARTSAKNDTKAKPVAANGGIRKFFNTDKNIKSEMMPPVNNVLGEPKTNRADKKASGSGNLHNVVGFKDLTQGSPIKEKTPPKGQGYRLNSENTVSNDKPHIQNVRDIWAKRFSQTPATKTNATTETKDIQWTVIDSDICVNNYVEKIDLLSDSDDSDDVVELIPSAKKTLEKRTHDETTIAIKNEIVSDSDDESDIELIDNEFDDDLVETVSITGDTSIIDDLFGEDSLLNDFKQNNDVVSVGAGSSSWNKVDREIISCPICQDKMCREMLDLHLDGCQGITIAVKPKVASLLPTGSGNLRKKPLTKLPFYKNKEEETKQLLLRAGYSPSDLAALPGIEDDDEVQNESSTNEPTADSSTETVACPVCSNAVKATLINEHLDSCL